MTIPTDATYAAEHDAQDPLAHFRQRFVIADPDLIYMDGNSLGRLPRATVPLAEDLIERQWGARLIRGWKPTRKMRQEIASNSQCYFDRGSGIAGEQCSKRPPS